MNDLRNDRLASAPWAVNPGVEVRIAPDGEILARGPNIMQGYYNEPELTREAIDAEGWLHTGDIGEITNEGFLRITDRKKEIFKTSGGKYVAPQVIENRLKQSRFIEQAMVIGENRKFPAALIVPDFAFLKDYCALKGIPFENREQVVADKLIMDRLFKEVEAANADMGNWERVKKIHLLPKEMSIDGGELTPSLKLRRKVILAKYTDAVERIYAD
ncbi:MAG: AMP-binding protein [Flavobacteriales bacterium]|nr:AMP-binding protein [Flavobacteriales bacterium]